MTGGWFGLLSALLLAACSSQANLYMIERNGGWCRASSDQFQNPNAANVGTTSAELHRSHRGPMMLTVWSDSEAGDWTIRDEYEISDYRVIAVRRRVIVVEPELSLQTDYIVRDDRMIEVGTNGDAAVADFVDLVEFPLMDLEEAIGLMSVKAVCSEIPA